MSEIMFVKELFSVQQVQTFQFFLITARKRSLGQGNIFRSVCQEFCSRGGIPGLGGAWSWEGAWSGGVPGPGGAGPGGVPVPKGGCLVWGGAWSGGSPGPQPNGKLRGIWSRSTHKGEVEGSWPGPPTATAAGGTHPTGMHSC